MGSSTAYCTVWFNQTSYLFTLEGTPTDGHIFLKEQLASCGVTEVSNRDIEVCDSDVGIVPQGFRLRPKAYRVTLLASPGPEADASVQQKWSLTLHLESYARLGYWPPEFQFPRVLDLQLHHDPKGAVRTFERQSHYQVDSLPLEAPFWRHYEVQHHAIDFVLDPSLDQPDNTIQQAFLQGLRRRSLMLRVLHLSAQSELLLRPNKDGTGLYGYIENKGTVESLAQQEFQAFLDIRPPHMVLVLDLDQTIVHTPNAAEQHYLESHADDGRAFDVSTKDGTLPRMLCAPRTHILQFFCSIKHKYHVKYCTAGRLHYGQAVVQCLKDYMLRDAAPQDQDWIRECTDPRRVTSSMLSTNNNFKSLGMLLKMSYMPQLTEQLVVILDDHPEVWLSHTDRSLVDMFPVKQQQYITSDCRDEPWLKKIGFLLTKLHHQVFAQRTHAQQQPMRRLPHVCQEVAVQQMKMLLRG